MAKKKANKQVNKSEAIRGYKADNPKAMPKEIAEELSKQGVDVSAQFVSTVLSTSGKKKKRVSVQKRPVSVKRTRSAPAKSRGRTASGGLDAELVLRVRDLCDQAGPDNVRDALDLLSALDA